eukprot:1346737-Rhodomonas_salina.7
MADPDVACQPASLLCGVRVLTQRMAAPGHAAVRSQKHSRSPPSAPGGERSPPCLVECTHLADRDCPASRLPPSIVIATRDVALACVFTPPARTHTSTRHAFAVSIWW